MNENEPPFKISNKHSNVQPFPINKQKSNLTYCIIYIIILFSILIAFLINFIFTKNAFSDYKTILLSQESICMNKINILNECLEMKLNLNKCTYENKGVETCYDQIHSINTLCYIYLSELDVCLNSKPNTNNKLLKERCQKQLKEVINCAETYTSIKLDKNMLISNIKQENIELTF